MSTVNNKAILVRAYEIMSKGDLDSLDEIIDADYLNHNPSGSEYTGREGLKALFADIRSGFNDFDIQVHDLIVDGNTVVARVTFTGTHTGSYMGIPPTGKSLRMNGIDITRYHNGKAVERWGEFDSLGLLQQLGVIPAS